MNHAAFEKFAKRIEPQAGWKDLALPEEQKEKLREIAARLKQHTGITNEETAGVKKTRRPGIRAHFAGESGTGKTMACEALANELNLPLYRMDVQSVLNKYIGETEKKLKLFFNAANERNAILFFDEADALFGKRTHVKDSHDRYSNIEINYLLHSIETYPSLAIIGTSNSDADDAFLRKAPVVVQFTSQKQV